MADRIALITGGAKGIGRGIALDLATKQWKVAICYRTSAEEAEATAAEISRRGGQPLAVQCDVSDPTAAQQLVKQIEQKWGHIDALINGAGPYHRVNLFDETVAGWNEMFTGNLHPIFYLAQAAVPGMKAQKSGRIINFSMANADQMVAQPDVTARRTGQHDQTDPGRLCWHSRRHRRSRALPAVGRRPVRKWSKHSIERCMGNLKGSLTALLARRAPHDHTVVA